ncbi:hypothetical protein P175DRAFT_0524087 [Aspergillus ochraceoroseus IBT 24754]|uniref:Uncharacterized protein n=3 Tax=Aspergillus subgen. Nidulantes TaxID=2720870 RepID=A0A0F8X9I5_9EURO|nr:uncharacterized protein P175DRAFT_0524087 [Aspergillus ochraceoroseus IBT 24754]KKK19026.1 hypothetical protein AOCH_006192 [Aspergillus ochraceoroseus]KKK20262.1 hypothetical protein ARAM_004118 [Aspergillus rambellii]PTU19753.1 hypothetical protein P175DRAFT_0524087 [Aspergillus ochraceoroseus IBT 24754]
MEGLHTLIPCLASFVAFLLGILCLLSGTQRQCLPKADLLTLHLDAMVPPIPGAPDFFSVYVMSYCEGVTGNRTQNGTSETNVVTTIRSCSDQSVFFSFNPTAALEAVTGNPPSSWPSYISDDFQALAPTNRTMAFFYVIGAGAAGLVLLIKLFSIWSSRTTDPGAEKPPSSLLFLVQLTSALSLFISSILGSAISSEFVHLINKSGALTGIYADHGSAFLGMSWTAVVLQTIGTVGHLVLLLMYNPKHCSSDLDEPEKPLVADEP